MFLIYQHWGYGMSVDGVVDSVENGKKLSDQIVESWKNDQVKFDQILNQDSEEPTIRYISTYFSGSGKNRHEQNKNVDFNLIRIKLNERIENIEAEG